MVLEFVLLSSVCGTTLLAVVVSCRLPNTCQQVAATLLAYYGNIASNVHKRVRRIQPCFAPDRGSCGTFSITAMYMYMYSCGLVPVTPNMVKHTAIL